MVLASFYEAVEIRRQEKIIQADLQIIFVTNGIVNNIFLPVMTGFFAGDLANLHQSLHQRVVFCDLRDAVASQVVGPAVAHVGHDRAEGVGPDEVPAVGEPGQELPGGLVDARAPT